jgi:hypothetical protein
MYTQLHMVLRARFYKGCERGKLGFTITPILKKTDSDSNNFEIGVLDSANEGDYRFCNFEIGIIGL